MLEGNDCSPIPATVNAGRPPRDICVEARVDERYGNMSCQVSNGRDTIFRVFGNNEHISRKLLYFVNRHTQSHNKEVTQGGVSALQ